MKKNILHVISSLDQGGAEASLYKLLLSMDRSHYNILVIVLRGQGYYSSKIEDLKIKIFYLNISKFNLLIKMLACINIIKKIKPDVVQSWMYHADLFGGVCAKLCGVKKIIWGVRCDGK